MSVDLVKIETSSTDDCDSVPPSPVMKSCWLKPCPNSTTVLIGRNGRGQWIARERYGLYGGLFISRENAVRYTMFENGYRPEAIIIVAGILELDLSSARLPAAPSHLSAFPVQNRAA